jgi:glycosyltransferase involved in cell wall biosynthesis
MRVLHMTPELPYAPGGGGGREHEYLLLRRLVERGHTVLNLSPVMSDESAHSEVLRRVGVENWTTVRPASPITEITEGLRADPRLLATAIFSPVRVLEMQVFWTRLRELAHRAVSAWRPDVLIVCHEMAAGWATPMPRGIPAVLTLHDLVFRQYLSRARLAGPIARGPLLIEAARFRAHLRRSLPRFAAATAVSTIEAAELRRLAAFEVAEITVGTEVRELAPVPEPDGPPRVVFTGSLGYEPNERGITWFCDQVWPQILHDVPEATLEIVGRDPSPSVLALGDQPQVTVVGPVPEMRPYLDSAHLVVVPILNGAGVRVKIVEAMAAQRAIVSTSLGWEGLPHLEPGRHLVVADEPNTFARAVIRLLGDRNERELLARRGRELALAHYDWRSLGDELEALLHDVTAAALT